MSTTLTKPIDSNLDAGQALIVFDTGMGNQIPLKAKMKNEDTGMIRLFTNLEILRNLVKRFSDGYGYTEGFRN
jgi:hypothetical protein